MKVERPHSYQQDSNCQDIHHSNILISSKDLIDKDFVNEANKIIFDFIRKGKDKIKSLALISDISDGGL